MQKKRTKKALQRQQRVTKTWQGNNDDYIPTSNPSRSKRWPSQVGIAPTISFLALREQNRKRRKICVRIKSDKTGERVLTVFLCRLTQYSFKYPSPPSLVGIVDVKEFPSFLPRWMLWATNKWWDQNHETEPKLHQKTLMQRVVQLRSDLLIHHLQRLNTSSLRKYPILVGRSPVILQMARKRWFNVENIFVNNPLGSRCFADKLKKYKGTYRYQKIPFFSRFQYVSKLIQKVYSDLQLQTKETNENDEVVMSNCVYLRWWVKVKPL